MSQLAIRFFAFVLVSMTCAAGCRHTIVRSESPPPPAPAPAAVQPTTQPATTQPAGASSPEALMDEVIALLTQKQYEQVFRRYLAPEDLERLLAKRSMQEVMDNYMEIDGIYLHETLEQAQALTPHAFDGGDTLMYHTTVRMPLVLVKRDGRWYIQN